MTTGLLILTTILKILFILAVTVGAFAPMLVWAERRGSALIQDRLGPAHYLRAVRFALGARFEHRFEDGPRVVHARQPKAPRVDRRAAPVAHVGRHAELEGRKARVLPQVHHAVGADQF